MSNVLLRLQDFSIEEPAEVSVSGSRGSFRGFRRSDNLPVLLHRFRPANTILERRPIVICSEPPSISQAFLTYVIAVIESAGSAYLVEPLPDSAVLPDVWRAILQQHPDQASGFAINMVRQVSSVLEEMAIAGGTHGAIEAVNIVVTEAGICGILASHVPCQNSTLWLRPPSQNGLPADDFAALGGVVDQLLIIQRAVSVAQGRSALSPENRQTIIRLAEILKQIGRPGMDGPKVSYYKTSQWSGGVP